MTAKTAKRKTTKKIGRPRASVDRTVVEGMAYAGGTNQEIADYCGVSKDTIERRFRLLLVKQRAARKIKLRQMQWKAAMAGDRTMLVWLGKVELAQREMSTVEHTGKDGQAIELKDERKQLTDKVLGMFVSIEEKRREGEIAMEQIPDLGGPGAGSGK